eukprot:scaffold258660_cov21-Tisochrysis_lutea.AAC.1
MRAISPAPTTKHSHHPLLPRTSSITTAFPRMPAQRLPRRTAPRSTALEDPPQKETHTNGRMLIVGGGPAACLVYLAINMLECLLYIHAKQCQEYD